MDIDDYLLLSGIQHYAFCPRQWALIHLECQWVENECTVMGSIVHERAHNGSIRERRGDLLVVRGLRVVSHELKLVGVCDVVEFCQVKEEQIQATGEAQAAIAVSLDLQTSNQEMEETNQGVHLFGEEGLYVPFPVEYKKGHQKMGDEDRLQLCAQAMALEEMYFCKLKHGFLYYHDERHREDVALTDELRNRVRQIASRMWNDYHTHRIPQARASARCKRCSLLDACQPALSADVSVSAYIAKACKEQLT